jgi:TldD protein
MSPVLDVDLIERVRPAAHELCTSWARTLPDLAHADLRIEVTDGKFAAAEHGDAKTSGADAAASIGVRVLAGGGSVAPGYAGRTLGAADLPALGAILRETLLTAYRRATANARGKAHARAQFSPLGRSLVDTRLAPIPVSQDVVPAVFEVDPRGVPLDDMVAYARDVSRQVTAVDRRVEYDYVVVSTALQRELVASSEGVLVDQCFALTQGLASIVVTGPDTSQELYDVVAHQRGWEIMHAGIADPLAAAPPFADFALALAREGVELVAAPALPTLDRPVTVVTDPHFNALVAHEVLGHPVELDRGLKMETAYAGRSWFLRGLTDHEVGRRVASPLVTAYSDPSLPGYGQYRYDHEGTPGRRVVHVDRGVFAGFLNSRQTAAVFGGEPNGHYKSTDAALVPLIRMSTTVFAGGDRDPAAILAEVDDGYYLAGHKIPSIAESRENFRISARRVYEIRGGRLGRLYRDGGIMADTRDYLMAVDATGSDFRLYPIPNCGKGQPMQTKRLGNGGPTMRSRAIVTGGAAA